MRVLLVALMVAFTSIAAAHTPLTASIPAATATVPAPVKEIVLEFGGDVRLTAMVLTDAQGGNKKLAAVPAAVAKKFTLTVEDDLKPGAYTVNWRAVGADTHVVSGDFRFTVAAATPL
ncbi:MAG: copper resistance CopC family protein [Gammaproteobacteria bacterium]